ncbi:uncharacterized protein At3g06530 isoform X2 [Physcomitrium patens]|uniref:BP28 C-terminal domain-containing protein n=1 Tax=Physcomitrium patens TaxID=3218 RepID=A0A2K1KU09_PHYPA|nr:uncharacterized protein At3g06530-like isoform X2 [Physcomitrium patens]PNR57240.1 hypothetical protein PHYPA_004233 [Physcomitrium patens]|eukprot:XP_024370435.1 uncharacterized protein At3g06530-like isoform X2 [Physcomitrella patens]
MASALASQLEALAVATGQPTSTSRKIRASIIFTPSQAADVDLRTIYDLCDAGLGELADIDGRFEPYRHTLFSVETLKLDRELQSRELNDKLNRSIGTFIRVLSNYILLKPAHQVLEYLIRRYKIHIYNVEDILISILPYHETSLFVRILQLLQIKNTKWAFLERVQKSGAAPTRAALVDQCRRDPAVLDTLCEAAVKVARMPSKTRTIASFTSIVVMELLATVPSVQTSTVNRILPFVLHSFEGGITEDYRVGALMVIGTLANRTSLSSSLAETLIVSIAKKLQIESAVEGAPLTRISLMVMIQLMQTQAMDQFPVQAFKMLVKSGAFFELLAKLIVMYDASKFLSLFLEVLVKHCAAHVNYERSLVAMIDTIPLKDYVGQLVANILQLYMGNIGVEVGEQRNCKEISKHLFRVIEKRFPTELDSAISSVLENRSEPGKSQRSAQQEALNEIFLGTLHMPLVESNKTLYASLDHPEARVRVAAVKRLAEIDNAQNNNLHTQMKDMMWETLFQRAHDEDYGVLEALLSVESLVHYPYPEKLFKMLTSIISRSLHSITSGVNVDARVIATASSTLKLLASGFLTLHPTFAERVATVLFGLCLTSRKTLQLNLVALKLARTVPFALFEALPEFPESISGKAKDAKNQKEQLLVLVNEKLVSSLTTCVLKKSEILLPVLLSTATDYVQNKCLALAVLLRILHESPKGSILNVVDVCLPWLRGQLVALQSKNFDFKNAPTQQEDYSAAKIRLVEFELLDTQPSHLHADLLLKNFYKLLEVIPTSFKGKSIQTNDRLKTLYEILSSARAGDKFSSHMQLLLKRLSGDVFPFLSSYFISGDFEKSTHRHSHSLDLLAFYYSDLSTTITKERAISEKMTVTQLQVALPAIVVGLASPVQKVRRSAAECLEQLYALLKQYRSISPEAKKKSTSLPNEVLHHSTFEKVVTILVESKAACTSNEQYVATVLENLLNDSESKTVSTTEVPRLMPADSKAVVNFFTAHALRHSAVVQRILFSVLKGTGHDLELLGAVAGPMENLLERRSRHHLNATQASDVEKLSPAEVDVLCILLQMFTPKAAKALSAAADVQKSSLSYLLESLKVEGGSTSDPVVLKPCISALGCLTSEFTNQLTVLLKDELFQALIRLSSSTSSDIHAPAQAVLRNITVPSEVIAAYLGRLSNHNQVVEQSPAKKRRVKPVKTSGVIVSWSTPQQQVSCTAAVLEVLTWLPIIENRQELVVPLFELLKFSQSEKWPLPVADLNSAEAGEDGSMPRISLDYIQQLIFINLERLATFVLTNSNRSHAELFDIGTIVHCVANTSDSTTRNQALMVLIAIARVFPQKVLKHIVDIFSVVGSSTITQDDKYSHDVTQQLLVVVVPFWLETSKDPTALLQIIVTALPRVPSHRRMSLVTTLLRVMKEKDSLHLFLRLLLDETMHVTNGEEVAVENGETNRELQTWMDRWEVKFAEDLCQEYAPSVWLPALVKLLKATSESISPAARQFITYQLQGLHGNDISRIPQEAFVALLGQVVMQLHSGKKENQLSLVSLLDCLTLIMAPITYLEGLIRLLKNSDKNICRKVLLLYTARMKMQDENGERPQRSNKFEHKQNAKSVLKKEPEFQERMVSQLSDILVAPTEDSSANVKLAALEALERCATRLANTDRAGTLINIVPAVLSILSVKKKALSVAGVRCVGTLVSILGPRALPSLPDISTQLFIMGRDASLSCSDTEGVKESNANSGTEIIVSILKTLIAIVEHLGAFINPYLNDLISYLVLQRSVIKSPDVNVSKNAATLRELISEKIPARLLLDPLIVTYERSISVGPEATSALFLMVAAVASRMDRTSVPLYYVKIFNVCLQALDFRTNRPSNFASITEVEKSVIDALSSLVLKLSENSFKPLFVNLLDWALASSVESSGLSGNQPGRRIAFFGVVQQLLEKLRSLFVPYFSYLLDICISTLTDGQFVEDSDPAKPKKKKKRASDGGSNLGLSFASWHLRQLVLSSLHKCFLYDTIGFLDSAKFQQLLGPIVSQILVDAPLDLASAEDEYEKIATVEEMDDTLVSCVSRMALTAGSDLFWKPLNREVLMCTRNKKLRARLLALRIVKELAENLKEEYLVLLPETLPFLAELLEDSELEVVAKSQEIIKILETNSGESLSQYF